MSQRNLLDAMVSRHRGNGLLIDTNLLLLFVVGIYDRRRIEGFKRTAAYTQSDFQRIGWLTQQFSIRWTTPNILTEVDNLGRQLPQREWKGFATAMITVVQSMRELSVPSASAATSATFARVGLCDSASLQLPEKFLLISDDLDFYLCASSAGFDAVNFNHLRT